jgi:urease subunit gamma
MELTPREKDKLLIFGRTAQGARPEAELPRGADQRRRDGARAMAKPGPAHERVLTRADVMDGVAEMIPDIQVEATFPDGTKLVTVHQPII